MMKQLHQSARKALLLITGLILSIGASKGQYFSSPPTIDGTADAGYSTSGAWSMGWDDTYLYIRYSGGNSDEPAIVYFDVDPITPISGGSNTNGSLAGQANWSITPTLPFRADFLIYWESNYAEYRTDNGSGGWNTNTVITTSDRSNTGTASREIRLPWTNMGLAGRPSSFNWFGYANSRANPGFIFNETPSANPEGAVGAPRINYYYTVSTTASSGTTNPFSQTSFEQRSGSGDVFISSTVSLFDITNNAGNLTDEIILENNSTTITVSANGSISLYGGITINSGEVLSLGNGSNVTINANGYVAVNSGTVSYNQTSSTLTYNNGGAYSRSGEWPSTNGPVNVTISNSGTNVTLGAARTLTGTLTVNSGCTLTSSGNLTLAGSTTTPGRIGNSAGTVSGSVNVEIAIPSGRRAYRMIGNPLTTSQALTTLTDDIHITGTGGAANGFDATTNNAPSAFSFSESTFNGTNNSGWTAYTNTSQTIAANGAARIFYRGPRSQSGLLDGSNPSPNAGTLDLTGTVNSGTVNVAMGYTAGSGANAGWNLIPNPYPSNVDIGSIASGNRNSIANFAVWVPTSGTRGAYVSQSFGSSYIIPTGGAFFVQTGSAANFTFSESDKTASSVSASLLKTDPFKQNAFQINVTSNDTIFWDQYVFRHREGTQQGKDELDAPKMQNPDVNFFAKTNEGFNLSIDNRVVSNNMIVPLSFETGSDYNFTFTVPFINLPGVSVFLADKFLKTETELTEGMKYNFETSSDPASKGDGRFELLFKGSVNGKSELVNASLFSLYPNPATEQINLTLTHAAKGTFNYTIINQLGAQVMEGQFDATNYRNQSINVSELPAGVYFVNLNNGETSQTIKFIK